MCGIAGYIKSKDSSPKEFEKTIQEARDFIREKKEIVEKAEQQITGAN